MEQLMMRKLGAFVPYTRWTLTIITKEGVEYKYFGTFSSEDDAKIGCSAWFQKLIGKNESFDNIIKNLNNVGIDIVISQ